MALKARGAVILVPGTVAGIIAKTGRVQVLSELVALDIVIPVASRRQSAG